VNGTLALVGSGEYLPPMEPVDRLLLSHLQETPRVVCLPTAAGNEGPRSLGYWAQLSIEHFTRLGAQVEAVQELVEAGIPREAIVLGFRPQHLRQYTGYAVT